MEGREAIEDTLRALLPFFWPGILGGSCCWVLFAAVSSGRFFCACLKDSSFRSMLLNKEGLKLLNFWDNRRENRAPNIHTEGSVSQPRITQDDGSLNWEVPKARRKVTGTS